MRPVVDLNFLDFAYGAMAGLYAALVVGVTSVAFGDGSTTVYAPRITTTFILGGLLYHLVNSNEAIVRSGAINTFMHILLLIVLDFAQYLIQSDFFTNPAMMDALADLFVAFEDVPQPIVAVVEGAALGALRRL